MARLADRENKLGHGDTIMIDDNSMNEGAVEAAPSDTGSQKAADYGQKISDYSGKVDAWVEKLLGIVGDHPWMDWLAKLNGWIVKFLPAGIALAGLLSIGTYLVTFIKMDAPISYVFKPFLVLIPTVFAMHLAPKALSLTRSFVEKGEVEAIRPEMLYIMKVVFGLGGLLLAIAGILTFEKDGFLAAIILIVLSVLMIICLQNPSMVKVKAGYPTNCVEEAITLILFPLRVVLAFFTPIIGIAVVGGIIYGIVCTFESGLEAATVFVATAVVPFLLPLIVYYIYLMVMFTIDFYRAIVSIPRKLDEINKKN